MWLIVWQSRRRPEQRARLQLLLLCPREDQLPHTGIIVGCRQADHSLQLALLPGLIKPAIRMHGTAHPAHRQSAALRHLLYRLLDFEVHERGGDQQPLERLKHAGCPLFITGAH